MTATVLPATAARSSRIAATTWELRSRSIGGRPCDNVPSGTAAPFCSLGTKPGREFTGCDQDLSATVGNAGSMSSQLTAPGRSPEVRTVPRRARLRDRAWKVAELATTPLVPADYLDLLNPLRPG